MQSSTPGTTRGAVLLIGLAALLATIIIACGSPSATTALPATQAPQPTATVAIAEPTPTGMAMPDASPGSAEAAPTAMPEPVATEPAVVSSRDSITVVTSGEPVNMDIHSDECSGNIDHLVCQELTVDPFTWIDGTTFEVQGLTGIDRWEQVSPDRWRFFLRPGIIFHNGEPWNAAAAKFGLDLNGTGVNGGGFSQHSFIEGEVVDDLTIDVLCQTATRETRACPIFPRQGMFDKFAAPEWYASASDEDRARTVVSNGPYRFVSWNSGVDIRVEAFEDYQPKPGVFATNYPSIANVRQIWRTEALVRAAAVKTGEADWADNIGFENATEVPKAVQAGTNEIYTLVSDNIWHPELKKKEVRMALAHAIDCQAIVESLYDGRNECFGNISQPGTLGINEQNSAPLRIQSHTVPRIAGTGRVRPRKRNPHPHSQRPRLPRHRAARGSDRILEGSRRDSQPPGPGERPGHQPPARRLRQVQPGTGLRRGHGLRRKGSGSPHQRNHPLLRDGHFQRAVGLCPAGHPAPQLLQRKQPGLLP